MSENGKMEIIANPTNKCPEYAFGALDPDDAEEIIEKNTIEVDQQSEENTEDKPEDTDDKD